MRTNIDYSGLKEDAHIHLIGICGTAMASLAGIFQSMGYKVTGSDQNPYPPMSTQLADLGIEVMHGYKAENLEPKPDLVIVGNVISRHFEEAEALLASDIPYTSLPQSMGEFVIGERQSLVVAGTHGKTTTTSLLSWTAEVVGKQPGFLIGGIPQNFAKSFRKPEADLFVIEGDEYDTAFFDKVPKFIHYRPHSAILTSLEFDHADIYNDLDDVKAAFSRLVDLIPEDGNLVACADSELVMEQAKITKSSLVTYGLKNGDYQPANISIDARGTSFDVTGPDGTVTSVLMNQYGDYNVLNALAVFALAESLGWPKDKVLEAFKTFKGVKRRQEIIGEPGGVTVIEDFAHHPTAVKMTIEAMNYRYPERRIFAVFEPRSATSRRRVFQEQYVQAFQHKGPVVLAEPYDQSKISEEDRFSVGELIADLKANGVDARSFASSDEISDYVCNEAKSGDVVLVMSNGGFDGLYGKLLEGLEKSH